MGSRRSPHVLVVALVIAGAWHVAAGQGRSGSGSGVATAPVQSQELPDWAPGPPDWSTGPPSFAVTPFENHVPNGKALEWIVAEAPFEIAEKSESVLGLDAMGYPLFVPGQRVPADPDTVAAYAAQQGVQYVVTGWFDMPGGALRLDVVVWKVDGHTAALAGEGRAQGPSTAYHHLLGQAMGEAWSKAGVAAVDLARAEKLARPLSSTIYPVFMMGRGLGELTGAIAAMDSKAAVGSAAPPDFKDAQHDLERAVFLDPKLYEDHRLLGELYLAMAPGDPKAAVKAQGKFDYAHDLAPDDVAALRATAYAAARGAKWEDARTLFAQLVTRRPWDLDARYRLGDALWHLGQGAAAARQLEQVTAHQPDNLAARRVLVLIHAAASDTPHLVHELEAIAVRAPGDLEVKSDLATAYGALGRWANAVAQLQQIAQVEPDDLALAVRLGDALREAGDLPGALRSYAHAQRIAPDSSLPGFAAAQALFDAGKLDAANRAYINLQKFAADLPAAQEALGAIALRRGLGDDAAWYLRQAVRAAPRSLVTRRAAIAAELMRKDPAAAGDQLAPALAAWPDDGQLHYLTAIAKVLAGDAKGARAELVTALADAPELTAARSAIGVLDAGGTPVLAFTPELERPWGDGTELAATVARFDQLVAQMADVRQTYQTHLLALLGALGQGPDAKLPYHRPGGCPIAEMAAPWREAQAALAHYERLGLELELAYQFIDRHDQVGLVAGLLPNARTDAANARARYQLALQDVAELLAEWKRGLGDQLAVAGCNPAALDLAAADVTRFREPAEAPASAPPAHGPARVPPLPKPRSTFFVDNASCPDPVDVWIDGSLVGQVAPGRRSALVADSGEHTMCLLGPGAAQCGDRGTVRQVYLHDGWRVTLHCPR